MAIVFVGMTLAIFAHRASGWLSITLLIAGVGIAPALAVMFAIVSSSVKFSDTAEAYGWVGTGQLIGAAVRFGDRRLPRSTASAAGGGLIVGAVLAAFVGVVVPLVVRRWLPDLRGRDASPLPDTEPVHLPPDPSGLRSPQADWRPAATPVSRAGWVHGHLRSPSATAADPHLGFGVYKVDDAEAETAVGLALDAGYRHVDTAEMYGNERGVGQALRASGARPRRRVRDDQGVERPPGPRRDAAGVRREPRASWGSTHVDLYLIHWPAAANDRYVETWRALEKIRADGRARSRSASRTSRCRTSSGSSTRPARSRRSTRSSGTRGCRSASSARSTSSTTSSPRRGRRSVADGSSTTRCSSASRTRTASASAQVLVRWNVQQGVVVLPKSVTPSRIRSNLDVDGFELTDDDLAAIAGLESGQRTGSHPDSVA